MVRLKTRYILFEVLYPCDTLQSRQASELVDSNTDILLRHHKVSPSQVSSKTIAQEVRRLLQTNFGDYGLGKAGSLLQVKYFSNRTSTGIIRCHRGDTDLVLMALSLANRIAEVDSIILNPVKVSGTIKKVEEYAIRRSQRLLAAMQRNDRDLLDDFTNISANEETQDE